MRSRLLAAALAAALALAACGGDDDSGGPSAAPEVVTPEAAEPVPASEGAATDETLPAGDGLLDFEAATVSGTTVVDLRQYEGSDLLVWFWAPW